jgi:2-phospho-L-lactate/phosphoenolpyruvate guanylyltransferase
MRTAAILPVKRFAAAKQRLSASVTEALRAELARAMVDDVLLALSATDAITQTIVVTGASSAAAAAREHGALVSRDSREQGQSAAVMLGVARALADRFERVLCIPGDCPALDPRELAALLELAPAPPAAAPGARGPASVVIVPDRHGTGTNGLVLTPPDAIAPSFGPGSFSRHLALAREAGVACEVCRPPSLILDIDTGEDLAALRDRLAGERERGAPRTRRLLSSLEPISSIGASA